ncbi:MAG: hypothetical protein JWP06_92 [Candidatus Saccharibacteria bacterium]|nr:hypothetical protein [Candidatus Saccharibacteria bacterium]
MIKSKRSRKCDVIFIVSPYKFEELDVRCSIFGRTTAAVTTTCMGDPDATLIMSIEPVDPSETTIMTIPGLIESILTDPVTFRRQACQPRRAGLDTTLSVTAAVCLTLGIGILGLSGAIHPIDWITSFFM